MFGSDVKVYNSNPELKAVGVSVSYTIEQAAEYAKCLQDPIYFITHYLKITSLDKGVIPFEVFPYQLRLLEALHNERKVVTMQPRQHGKTVTIVAYCLWYTLFHDVKTVVFAANKATSARELLSKYQSMYKRIPFWLQQGVVVWNKGDIELENGSKVLTFATTADGIRGYSANIIYVDECAFIPNTIADDFFTAIYPTISSGTSTKIFISSTPKGYNYFWKLWTDAEKGRNDFVPILVKYTEHPYHGQAWVEEQARALGELRFNQEVLCQFLGSSKTLLKAVALAKLSFEKPLEEDPINVYQQPIEGHQYVLVADTAKGVGGDYSTFSILDITNAPYRQVATYRNNEVSPLRYPSIIYDAAFRYNEAYVLIELNANEQIPYILANELEYENILTVTRKGGYQKLSSGFGGTATTLGITTDRRIKRIGCQNVKTLIEEDQLIVVDADTISEFSTFIEKHQTFAADLGYHDDMVMTLVLFGWVATDPLFRELNDINIRERMYSQRVKAAEEELTPFGGMIDGTEPPPEDDPSWLFQ